MSHIKSSRAIAVAVAAFAAVSLFAGVGVWFGSRTGVVALVVTPRQYVPLAPGATQAFTARAWLGDGTCSDVTSNGAAWSCSPHIGIMGADTLTVTAAVPAFGWIEGSYSSLATRIYVKVTTNGFWNSDSDTDGDGYSDGTEIASNDPPDRITLMNVRCRVK